MRGTWLLCLLSVVFFVFGFIVFAFQPQLLPMSHYDMAIVGGALRLSIAGMIFPFVAWFMERRPPVLQPRQRIDHIVELLGRTVFARSYAHFDEVDSRSKEQHGADRRPNTTDWTVGDERLVVRERGA